MGYHSQLKHHVADWLSDQPLPLKAALWVSSLVGGALVVKLMSEVSRLSRLQDWELATAIILGALGFALAVRLFRGRSRDSICLPDNIEVHRAFSPQAIEELRLGLHQDIYGGVAAPDDEIDKMYEKNPRMGVGLYDSEKRKYVAFATGWPLTDEAAAAIIAGVRTENDLTADDVLPEPANHRANYVLVPAFGATDREGRWQRSCFGLMLRGEMRKALKENFFGRNRRRPLTLLATGFSKGGEQMCRSLNLQVVRHISFVGKKQKVPVFQGQIRRNDLN